MRQGHITDLLTGSGQAASQWTPWRAAGLETRQSGQDTCLQSFPPKQTHPAVWAGTYVARKYELTAAALRTANGHKHS